jgi:hypothetical protein
MRRPHFVLGRQRLRPQRCRQAPEPAALSEASNDGEGHGEKKRALKAAHAQPRSEHVELEAASQEREENGTQHKASCEVEHLADPRSKKRPSPREIMKPPSRLSSSIRIGTIPFILRTQEFYGKVMAHIDNATDAKEQGAELRGMKVPEA